MIQPVIFYVLGFLTSLLLALMLLPLVWRRASSKTRKQIESAIPLTLSEIQADKDQMRAEFAMTTRRLERNVEALQERAAKQLLEINRKREAVVALAKERDERIEIISDLETREDEINIQLRDRNEELDGVLRTLSETERILESRNEELSQVEAKLNDASLSLDSRRIEMVTQSTQMSDLRQEVETAQRKTLEAERRVGDLEREISDRNIQLSEYEGKYKRLEERLENFRTELVHRESELDKRTKDLNALRSETASEREHIVSLETQIDIFEQYRVGVEEELSKLKLSLNETEVALKNAENKPDILIEENENLKYQTERLLEKGQQLGMENELLKKQVVEGWNAERVDAALNRERINDLSTQIDDTVTHIADKEMAIDQILKEAEKIKGLSDEPAQSFKRRKGLRRPENVQQPAKGLGKRFSLFKNND